MRHHRWPLVTLHPTTTQVGEGASPLAVGTPVALFVEEEADVGQALRWQCPTTDVYDEGQPQVAILPWQVRGGNVEG